MKCARAVVDEIGEAHVARGSPLFRGRSMLPLLKIETFNSTNLTNSNIKQNLGELIEHALTAQSSWIDETLENIKRKIDEKVDELADIFKSERR